MPLQSLFHTFYIAFLLRTPALILGESLPQPGPFGPVCRYSMEQFVF